MVGIQVFGVQVFRRYKSTEVYCSVTRLSAKFLNTEHLNT